MKNSVRISALFLCACLLLAGCNRFPQAREMGDMALLRAMGVDRDGDGVAVTVSTGPRARGLQAEGEPALTLSAKGGSLSAAALAIQGQSDNFVFFGYVDQLLLGEELARASVLPVLDYFARDAELGLGAQLWIVRGSDAGTAVGSGGEEGVDSRLSTLRTDGKMGVAAVSRTAGEVYADLLELGAAYVPALVLGDGDASLEEGGYAILKDGALVGSLEGDAARGLELLAGKPERDILELELDGGRAVVEIVGARTACRPVREMWEPEALELTCRVEGRLAERDGPVSGADRARLEEALAACASERLKAALDRLQDWDADCVGLSRRDSQFDQMEVRTAVEAAVAVP